MTRIVDQIYKRLEGMNGYPEIIIAWSRDGKLIDNIYKTYGRKDNMSFIQIQFYDKILNPDYEIYNLLPKYKEWLREEKLKRILE